MANICENAHRTHGAYTDKNFQKFLKFPVIHFLVSDLFWRKRMIMCRKVLYRVVIVDSLFVIDSGFVVDVHNLVGFGIDFKFLILQYRLGSAIGSKWFKTELPFLYLNFVNKQ